jgi:hypothetical protein
VGAVLLVCLLTSVAACGGGTPGAGDDEGTMPDRTPRGWLEVDAVGAEPSEFIVLAGHWIVQRDGEGAFLRLDGSNSKIGAPPSRLPVKAAILFPDSAEAFEAQVLRGLQFAYGVQPDVRSFTDGEIEVDFRLVGGVSDQFAGILFGLNEDGNHYAYRYNTKDGDTALWRVVDGERQRIHHGGTHVVVPMNEWRTLRLRIAGADVTGWLNDTQTLQFTLPAAPAGRIGLWSKPDVVTDYRNFRAVR